MEMLEAAVLPALRRPPCVVQFSGGRDSSLVLAVALRLARRHGLPDPIAFTRRFPGLAEAEERDWQERVVRHLGVVEWDRMEVADELDLVGPVAGPSLERVGVVWPPLVHVRRVDLARARGGALLDGEGGDELFGPGRLAPLRTLVSPAPGAARAWRDVVRACVSLSPGPVRRVAALRRTRRSLEVPWLRPAGWAALEHALAVEEATEPLDRRRSVLRHLTGRGLRLAAAHLRALAAEYDTSVVHPLLHSGVVAAVARAGGRLGFADRTAALRALFPGLLPEAVLARTTKARFNRAVFNVHSRAFAARWTGGGVDEELVDAAALARTWAAPEVHAMSFALLQSAWLASR